MPKSKKITFNMLASDLADTQVQTITFKGKNHEYVLSVKRVLGMQDAKNFVQDVIKTCIDYETNSYQPELLNFAFMVFTLVYYAGLTIPANLERAYTVVYGTGIYSCVKAQIDAQQHEELYDSIKDKLTFETRMLVASQTSMINELIQKMDNVMEEGNKTIDTLSSSEFSEQIKNVFQYVNGSTEYIEDDSSRVDGDDIIVLNK